MPFRSGVCGLALALGLASGPLRADTPPACGDKIPVVIDIGHSPRNSGAVSARGKPEYLFNKRLVGELAAALRSDGRFESRILNEAGAEMPLPERARAVRAIRQGVFLSVHHDSAQSIYLESWVFERTRQRFSGRFAGYSLFVSGRSEVYEASKSLARSLGTRLREAQFAPSFHHAENIPGERRPVLDETAGVFRYDGLAILRQARVPAVLIEAGVIVNPLEELELEKPEFRARFVEAIKQGITSYCASRPASR